MVFPVGQMLFLHRKRQARHAVGKREGQSILRKQLQRQDDGGRTRGMSPVGPISQKEVNWIPFTIDNQLAILVLSS